MRQAVRDRPAFHYPFCQFRYDYDGAKCPNCVPLDQKLEKENNKRYVVDRMRTLAGLLEYRDEFGKGLNPTECGIWALELWSIVKSLEN